jgi:hypothetical protein
VGRFNRRLASKLNMSDESSTLAIVELHQQISSRLNHLGYENGHSGDRISRHLAEVAVLGRNFAEHTLPLFLSIDAEHTRTIGQLFGSLKCDLEELRDALTDVDEDLAAFLEFINKVS